MPTLTFSEKPVGTYNPVYSVAGNTVTTRGVITTDGANPTSPVLAGDYGYQAPVEIKFLKPVVSASFDAGYFDSIASTKITFYDAKGKALVSYVNIDESIQPFTYTSLSGISKISIVIDDDEPAGFAIDNLSFKNLAGITPINLSSASNTYRGTSADNVVFGKDGNDNLSGLSADDILDGGNGNDILDGDTGNDLLIGQTGNDKLYGDEGIDTLQGGVGNDLLQGGADMDYLFGGDGVDLMSGGLGNDRLDGGLGNDRIWGDDGNDIMQGGAGNDQLYGGNGNDRIGSGPGNEQIDGGSGYDIVTAGDIASRYTLTAISGGWQLTDKSSIGGSSGIDILKNIEAVKFMDMTVTL